MEISAHTPAQLFGAKIELSIFKKKTNKICPAKKILKKKKTPGPPPKKK